MENDFCLITVCISMYDFSLGFRAHEPSCEYHQFNRSSSQTYDGENSYHNDNLFFFVIACKIRQIYREWARCMCSICQGVFKVLYYMGNEKREFRKNKIKIKIKVKK